MKQRQRRLSARATSHDVYTERKIYIYEIDAGQKDGQIVEFDPGPALLHISALPFKMEGRYLDAGERNVMFVEPVSLEFPQKLIFVLSRRSDLPELERNGQMTPLPIPADGGLGEKVHVVFFGRYAAADFNFRGPRPSTLPTYFALKAKGIGPSFRMHHLIRGEATEDLEKLDGLVLAKFKFHESALHLVESADDSLAAAFRSVISESDADELELVLRKKRMKGVTRYLRKGILNAVRQLAHKQATYEEFARLQAVGINLTTAKREEVDVLNDQLILKRRMVKNDKRSRAVMSESAFEAIEDAFREATPRLNTASSLE